MRNKSKMRGIRNRIRPYLQTADSPIRREIIENFQLYETMRDNKEWHLVYQIWVRYITR